MGSTGNSSGLHLHLGIFTGPQSNSPVGYTKNAPKDENGKYLPHDYPIPKDQSQYYFERGGRTFYDPMLFIETGGAIMQ